MVNILSRRNLLKTAGAVTAAAAVPAQAEQVKPAQAAAPTQQAVRSPSAAVADQQNVLFFFNDQEARFVETAIRHLIPADPQWPGAVEAGVLYFIDKQLASAYGAGGRMYLKGPWVPDAPPQQGYQLRYTPAELYRVGIEETRVHVRDAHNGREFWDLGEPAMIEVLKGLERGDIRLPSLPSPVFFETLLANAVEGFFADPAYGGNRDMVGWRMIGFPGAYAQYADLVELYDFSYTRRPIGISDEAARQAHLRVHHHRRG
jgi:gluconate 2-dehydrogenase gamma chain